MTDQKTLEPPHRRRRPAAGSRRAREATAPTPGTLRGLRPEARPARLIDTLGVFGVLAAYAMQSGWGVLTVVVLVLVAVNWIYFSRRTLPRRSTWRQACCS